MWSSARRDPTRPEVAPGMESERHTARASMRGMHVAAEVDLSPDQVHARIRNASERGLGASISAGRLRLEVGRRPLKLFLDRFPATLPTAAELAVRVAPSGSRVILRLMWGPLPAPFPRVVAALGVLLGLATLAAWPASAPARATAAFVAGAPTLALIYQSRGEKHLQAALGQVLGGATFSSQPH